MIDLARAYCAYLDTNVFIYLLEGPPQFQSAAAAVLTAAAELGVPIVSSEYALAECLYGAYRKQNSQLADQYRDIFRHSAVDLYPVETPLLEAAAEIGPAAGLRLPDAIHVATALFAECDIFITNDVGIRSQPGLRVALIE